MNSYSAFFRQVCQVATVWLLLSVVALAQSPNTGGIQGRVLNAAAGTYLGRALVKVEGTTLETYTDDIGEYRLANLPAGLVTLRASFTAMQTETATLSVGAGATVQQDFKLVISSRGSAPARSDEKSVLLDAFTVSDRAMSAEAAALQERKTAPNIKNVVAFEEFGDLGEGNPGEFLKFVPGVEINQAPVVPNDAGIRGMPSSGTLMLLDGVQFAGSNADSRVGDLIGTNIANIDRIEVTKVPTPDLPANAVGGTINIIPKSNLSLTRRALTYNIFGTQTTIDPLSRLGSNFGRGRGPAYKNENRSVTQPGFDVTYMLPVNPSLALSFSAGYSARVELRDILIPTWDLVNNIQTAWQKDPIVVPRERRLLSSTADFKLGSKHRFSVFAQYTDDHAYNYVPLFTYTYGAGVTGGANFSQGSANAVGSVSQNIQAYNQIRESVNGKIGYHYVGDIWKADMTVGLSRSQFNTRTLEDGIFRTFTATLSGVSLRAENLGGITSQVSPTITAKTAAGTPVDTNDVNLFSLATATGNTIPLKANEQVAKLDVGRDFRWLNPFSFKAGLAYENTERDIRNQTWSWTVSPPTAAGGKIVGNYDLIDTTFSKNWKFHDGSKLLWIDPVKAYRLYKDHPDYFTINNATTYISGVNGSKLLAEAISAAYVRADISFLENRLRLTTGVRFEQTDDNGSGPLNDPNAKYQRDTKGNLVLGTNGKPVAITSDALQIAQLQYKERGANSKSSYSGYYPSLNSSYTIMSDLLVRAAYARTIGRPNITQIIPGVTITDISTTTSTPSINENNTGLAPWHANNWDLSLESYNVKGAVASVSFFRKDVTGFFTSVQRPATPADLERYGLGSEYANYDLITTTNSHDKAEISGVELSWRQSLRQFAFVPEWAKGLQFNINTTRLSISGEGKDNFLPFRPRLLNWGVSYTARKALVRVNVSEQGPQRTAVLATNATTPAGSYQGIAMRVIADVSFEYRFTKRLALYGSARNLFQNPRRLFKFGPTTPEFARFSRYDYYGALLTFGIKGSY
ncbi:MAG: TonB-dependent receptor [Opitutaceae bacterium]